MNIINTYLMFRNQENVDTDKLMIKNIKLIFI